jgi:hypothetical protein
MFRPPREMVARVVEEELTTLIGAIQCVAVDADGTRYVCTASAIFASRNGSNTLVAGHMTQTGFKDGPGKEVSGRRKECG